MHTNALPVKKEKLAKRFAAITLVVLLLITTTTSLYANAGTPETDDIGIESTGDIQEESASNIAVPEDENTIGIDDILKGNTTAVEAQSEGSEDDIDNNESPLVGIEDILKDSAASYVGEQDAVLDTETQNSSRQPAAAEHVPFAPPASTYTIYYSDGGSSDLASQLAPAGSSIQLYGQGNISVAPQGYALVAWNSAPDESGTYYPLYATITPTEDMKLYTVWRAYGTATLCYDANGGSGSVATQTVPGNSVVTAADGTGFTRNGYVLASWNTSADGTGSTVAFGLRFVLTRSPMVLYAVWEPDASVNHTIRYDSNGGFGTIADQLVPMGNDVTLSDGTGVIRYGHRLAGWNTAADGSGTQYTLGASITPAADMTLYAVWDQDQPTTYIIRYSDGGNSDIAGQPFQLGSSVQLFGWENISVTPYGHYLTAWNTEPDESGTYYPLYAKITPTGDMKLYAVWRAFGAATLCYDANGGSGNIAIQTVPGNSVTTVANGTGFTRNGYTLTSWNTSADGTGANVPFGLQIVLTRTPMVLYAVWEKDTPVSYTIRYDSNGGFGTIADQIVPIGNNVTLSDGTGFTHYGYELVGWNTAADGSGIYYSLGSATIPAADMTLYAVWLSIS